MTKLRHIWDAEGTLTVDGLSSIFPSKSPFGVYPSFRHPYGEKKKIGIQVSYKMWGLPSFVQMADRG